MTAGGAGAGAAAGGAASATATWLRRFGPPVDSAVRLVCFPPAGGSAAFYRSWRERLPARVELYAVQYPGRLDRIRDPFLDRMDDLADAVAAAVGPLMDRQLALFGHSLGASVAYEVGRRLPAVAGRAPARLFASGRAAPGRQRRRRTHLADDDVLWNELARLGAARPEVIKSPELREVFLPALRSDYRLAETYRPSPGPPLACPVTALLGSHDSDVDQTEIRQWEEFTSAGFDLQVFPGDHFYLDEQLPELIDEIVSRLAPHAGLSPNS
jgi:pyochelin biosynthesis protein PchC